VATFKRRDIHKALQKKGFRHSNTDHDKFTYFTLAGAKTSIWTKTSYGSNHKDLSDINISRMARQCRLSNKEFADLVNCPLTREAYEALMVSTEQISSMVDKSH
jgi:hypothetical protein